MTKEAVRQARNAYYREWRAKNKDKVKQYNATYWKKRAEREAAAAALEVPAGAQTEGGKV